MVAADTLTTTTRYGIATRILANARATAAASAMAWPTMAALALAAATTTFTTTSAAIIATNALGLTSTAIPEEIAKEPVSPNHPWPIFAHPSGKEFVDYDEDLTIADIINATRDGYEHIQRLNATPPAAWAPLRAVTRH